MLRFVFRRACVLIGGVGLIIYVVSVCFSFGFRIFLFY